MAANRDIGGVFEAVADTFINPKRGGRETGRDRAG